MCQDLCLAGGVKLCYLSSKLQVALGGSKCDKFHVTITPSNSYALFLPLLILLKPF